MLYTSKQFWNKLDRITRKPQTEKLTKAFVALLKEAYENDLTFIALCKPLPDGDAEQLLYKGFGKTDAMIYFTSLTHAAKQLRLTPGYERYEMFVRASIDYIIGAPDISALIFNPVTENEYVIPKYLLTFAKPSE